MANDPPTRVLVKDAVASLTSAPATPERGPTATAAARPGTRASGRYWVCLVLLVGAAVGLKTAATRFGWHFRKEAVPLKLPLRLFDARALGPRYELNKLLTDRSPPLSEDMVDSLGTNEYVHVYVNDTQKAASDPTRVAAVFITYYTGKPDMVPHVPDECFRAGGHDPLSAGTATVRVPGVGAAGDEVPVRVLEFRLRSQGVLSTGGEVATVMYFFHANQKFVTTRDGVRLSLSNPLERYAYYAKIEVDFSSETGVRASKAAAVEALGPLLARVLPVLFRDHIAVERLAARPAGASGGVSQAHESASRGRS